VTNRSVVPLIVLLCTSLSLVLLPAVALGDVASPQSPRPFVGQRAPTVGLPEGPLPPGTGYVPMPIDLSHLKGNRMPGGIDASLLPDTWDWRQQGMVTRVQSQGACGACYGFSTLASFESKLLIDGEDAFDFSENHVKECLWEEATDWRYPDGSPVGSCDGGNWAYVANLLSQTGAVLESCDPYRATDVQCKTTCPYVKTALDWSMITEDAVPDSEVLKAYVYQQPVAVSIYAGDGDNWDREFNDYDGSYTLYYPGTETPNHGVLIVGWDETRSHPGGRGAWIVKNSWGTDWGDRGFFYIAYGSANIGWSANLPNLWQDYDATGGVMRYDDAGWNSAVGWGNTTDWGLSKFFATRSTWLTRVEFWTTDATTDVDVFLYNRFDGTSVGGLLWSRENLSYHEAGYHGVNVDPPVRVKAGDELVAVVKFTNLSYIYPVAIDGRGPSQRGRTYHSATGGDGSWSDVGDRWDSDVGIRLRTSDAGPPTPTPTSTSTATLTPTRTATSTTTPTQTLTPQRRHIYLPIILRRFHGVVRPTPTDTRPGEPTPTQTRTPTATSTPTRTTTPSATPTEPTTGWTTIVSEGFEGAFPGVWEVDDYGTGLGKYFWGKRDCRPYSGVYSGWAIGGGPQGSIKECYADYRNNVRSWMIYGPFSLIDATAARLDFALWTANVRDLGDKVFWGASLDNDWYSGYTLSEDFDSWRTWIGETLDLSDVPSLGNLLGEPQVWVGLLFNSDTTGVCGEGSYVDDIVLRKCTSAQCASVASAATEPARAQLSALPAPKKLVIPRPVGLDLWPLSAVDSAGGLP